MLELLKHFRSNWGYRLLAVILALILWVYVTSEQNPMGETLVRVPLETQNLSEDLVIADSPTAVQVRVEGRKIVINSLLPRDIRAYVDMRYAQAGDNFLPVRVEVPAGVDIIDINPAEARIEVEKIEQAQFPVQVSLVGTPASGFRALAPSIIPSQVLVFGPTGVLENIGRVFVEVNIDQATSSYMSYLPVKLENQEGQPLHQWLTINPPAVEVQVPIIHDMPGRVLPIRPLLTGEPAEGFAVERVIVQPEIIEVFAPYELLQALDYVNTAPIDITGARRQVIRETTLDIPVGVQSGIMPRVRVIVEIAEAPEVPESTEED
ncbi:MAG: hypothetical protein GX039_01865 [Clostridia bacterium]|nr:hypothetical protein [Clostridia bacterium]